MLATPPAERSPRLSREVEGLHTYFGIAANLSDAAAMALAAGVDQDMPGGAYLGLGPQVKQGLVPIETLDRATANVLTLKFAARLFDAPADVSLQHEIDAAPHRELARAAAEEGSVLLVNDGCLPLDAARLQRVAVVGPFGDGAAAQMAMLGGYSPGAPAGGVVTIAEAFRRRGIQVDFGVGSGGGVGGPTASDADFHSAVGLAAAADVAVVVIGTASCGCCVRCGNGEAGDRMSLELEGRQLELLAAVVNATRAAASGGKTPPPVVAVLVHGRPVSFEGKGPTEIVAGLQGVNAALAAWRPGEEGGTAVVNLLLGDVNPSGKLAQAWQRSAGYIHSPTSPWYQPHSS